MQGNFLQYFQSISKSSLVSKWHGDGEKLVKTLFEEAHSRSPSVVYINEVDSMLTQRTSDESEASRGLKAEFLVQLDGVRNTKQDRVLVIGATNSLWELDDAAQNTVHTSHTSALLCLLSCSKATTSDDSPVTVSSGSVLPR